MILNLLTPPKREEEREKPIVLVIGERIMTPITKAIKITMKMINNDFYQIARQWFNQSLQN
jgi:hypothetical protein